MAGPMTLFRIITVKSFMQKTEWLVPKMRDVTYAVHLDSM